MAKNSSKKPRTNKSPPHLPDIPHHLIFQEIFPRLPAKSLCRFKTVSREWNSVINTTLKLTSRSVLTATNDHDIGLVSVECYGDNIITVSNTYSTVNIQPSRFLISSCNGLVLMISCDSYQRDNEVDIHGELNNLDFDYVVYNPVLGANHFVEVPHRKEYLLADGDEEDGVYNFGFGYVSSRDDYYIVAIDVSDDSKIGLYTYSLRSLQWKDQMVTIAVEEKQQQREEAVVVKFQDPWYSRSGVLVNEALHWGMSEGEYNHFIFAYDLVSLEVSRMIDLPHRGFGDATLRGCSAFALCSLDDCLCAWANYGHNIGELWMMKEYGVVESWTMLFSFQMGGCLCCRNIFGFIKPKTVLLFTDVGLILADYSCDPPKISNAVLEDSLNAVSYFPSLVSVFALISKPRE